MELNIKIQNFDGPFDLLLHLLKENKMDIYDIKIYEITNQYIEYINKMKMMDLEITSEFIVMAATLIEMKSKSLLPQEIAATEDEQEDPRKQLMDKLVEYEKFKYAAMYLKVKQGYVGRVYSKKAEIIEKKEKKADVNFLKNTSLLELFSIYNNLINAYNSKINDVEVASAIPIESYKIEDKIDMLIYKFKQIKGCKFSDIVEESKNKVETIVTFLAMLELIRLKFINVYQDNNFDEIFIERVEKDEKE